MLATRGLGSEKIKFELAEDRIIELKIFDTAGQERFRSIGLTLLRITDCCILVYDITNKNTFYTCAYDFIESIKDMCKRDIKVILLGNKSDLERERQVSQEEGRNLAIKNNFLFSEISCKMNYNIVESFRKLIEITDKDIINKYKDSFPLKVSKIKRKKRKKCC